MLMDIKKIYNYETDLVSDHFIPRNTALSRCLQSILHSHHNLNEEYIETLRHLESQPVEYQANTPNIVKVLLQMPMKHSAIKWLAYIIPYVSENNEKVILDIVKALPAILSAAIMEKRNMNFAESVFKMFRRCSHFKRFSCLLNKWEIMVLRCSRKSWIIPLLHYVQIPLSASHADLEVQALTRTIGYSDIGLFRSIHFWLRGMQLHKYLYFYSNLDYATLMEMDYEHYDGFAQRIGLLEISNGAKGRMHRATTALRDRHHILDIIEKELMQFYLPGGFIIIDDDYSELIGYVEQIFEIVRTPIKKCHGLTNNEIEVEYSRNLLTKINNLLQMIFFVTRDRKLTENFIRKLKTLLAFCGKSPLFSNTAKCFINTFWIEDLNNLLRTYVQTRILSKISDI